MPVAQATPLAVKSVLGATKVGAGGGASAGVGLPAFTEEILSVQLPHTEKSAFREEIGLTEEIGAN
jgi:hypothetical protein